MAQHELLVKLGLQSDSFTRNIKNVNNQLKLTEAEFKKLETGTTNFGNSQKDLEAKLTKLKTTKEQLTAKTVLYKNKITELNTKIKEAQEKHEGIAKSLENEKKKLSELETTQGKNSKAYKEQKKAVSDVQQEYDKSKKSIENFNLSLQKHKIDLANTETEINKLDSALANLSFEKATFGINQLGSKLTSLSGKLDTMSQKMGAIGGTLTASVTTPLVLAGKSVVQFGAEFTASMSKVQALSGATGTKLESLEKKAREMGKATSFSAKEAADGLGYMALAGWDTEEMLKGIEPVLRLAEAGNLDLATTSDLVTDSMSSLGLEVEDLSEYLDKVAKASSKSNTDIDQLLRTYNQVGGTFQRLNVPLEESAALIGILANRGMKAEQAGRATSSLFINLTGGSKTAAKALDALGLTAYDSKGKFKGVEEVLVELHNELYKVENGTRKYTDAQVDSYLAMIGGKTQIRTLDAMLNGVAETTEDGTTEFQALKKEIINSNGALSDMAEIMKDNVQGDWEKFTSMVGELKLKINDLVEGSVRKLLQNLTNLTEKFINLDEDTQKFILKIAGIAAAIGPALLAISGITKGLSLLTGGIGSAITGVLGFAKNIKGVISLVKGGSSVFSALTATFAGFPAVIGIAAAALVAITATIGDNERMLASLQEKWGAFGTFLGGICEFISGAVKMSLGNLLTTLGGIGKGIVAVISGKWNQIDDIVRETNAKVQTNTAEAWSNMKLESTRALTDIRNMTERDMEGVSKAFEGALKTLPNVTRDNLNETGEQFANLFKSASGNILNLSDTSIKILRGTSDTMATLFSGIKGNMDIEEAGVKFTQNMEAMLRSGEINLADLEREFASAGDLIADNMANSLERVKNKTNEILKELGDIARDGLEPVSADIVSIVDGMSTETMRTLRGMGSNWSQLFKGISTDGSMHTLDMKNQILENMESLGLNTPEKLATFKQALITELEAAETAASQEGAEIGAGITNSITDGLNNNQEATKQEVKNTTTEIAKGATEGMTEGLADLPQAVHDELSKAGVTINAQGQVIVEDMAKKGGEAGKAYVNKLDKELPQLSGVSNKIQKTLAGIDSVRLGNVTKQLSEVNRWLGVVGTTSLQTKNNINHLTALKWGNTTKGLSEVNRWLGIVATSSSSTHTAINPLTLLKWGNTTKGLSEVNKWLGTVKNSASSAGSYLRSMTNVSFGGVTKGLSEVNKWLNTVKGNASSARTAISSVSKARSIQLNEENAQNYTKINIVQPEPTLYKYRTNYGEDLVSKVLSGSSSSNSNTAKSSANDNNELVSAIFSLVEALTNKNLSTSINIDGRQLASATAPLIKNQIEKIDSRRNRLAGI